MSYNFLAKKVMIVPFWVMEVLKRNKLTPDVLTDYDKLKTILSAKDLASIAIMTSDLLDDLLNTNYEYLNKRNWTNSVELPWYEKAYRDSTFSMLSSSPQLVEEIKERIYGCDISETISGHSIIYESAFDVLDINRDYIAVVINPGFFKEPGGKQYNINEANGLSLALTKAVLRVFNMYYKSHDVSTTSWFANYLRLLSLRSL